MQGREGFAYGGAVFNLTRFITNSFCSKHSDGSQIILTDLLQSYMDRFSCLPSGVQKSPREASSWLRCMWTRYSNPPAGQFCDAFHAAAPGAGLPWIQPYIWEPPCAWPRDTERSAASLPLLPAQTAAADGCVARTH